ncbi:MAG TPA: glycosyltransferase family 9 protein, partial [Verrucomicrobiota bacterium]|nr:glycosyltransferase family 9 protein [Verrucomicrobiota bacterium]
MENSPKILICKPSSLGDIVHALPVLRHIKKARPHARVHWWVNINLAPLLENDPDLEGLLLFDRKAWRSLRNFPQNLLRIRAIRRMQFDFVLDLQALLRSALFSWLVRAPVTIGLDERREAAPLFYHRSVARPHPNTHAVDWYLEVLKPLNIERSGQIDWMPSRPAAAETLRAKMKTPIDPAVKKVILQPCTRWQSKLWPLEHFIDCVKKILLSRQDVQFYVLGSSEDKAAGEAICREIERKYIRNLCGGLSLPEMVECIRLSDLMLTADTGP